MGKLSSAQAKILAAINAGGRLALEARAGRYIRTHADGKVCPVDQQPILLMIRSGLLQQTLTGECSPSDGH
ncbi:hypothetical protein p1D18 (plasmid) [Aromatoleum aromaticum EbN1]|uniref:Uncharacterized protein n=1 Tax=Aromatoleum aromaticum (strain DSM 19018 / LMG 30748 / EbN1) TaxID=76114 RepID=Q5NWZ6_AROAE|nr:hypothetical protein [Aromatoleum aromaticum]CAI10418.1 hypothetical protein p1D18 [Aromatoleum aromaticum EbN1]